MHRALWTLSLLVTGLAACVTPKKSAHRPAIDTSSDPPLEDENGPTGRRQKPSKVLRDAFASSGGMTLFAIDPMAAAGKGEAFAGYKVLGKRRIKSAAKRAKIRDALLEASRAETDPSDCFNPHDGIRLDRAGRGPLDLVVCFECSAFELYDGKKRVGGGSIGEDGAAAFER